MPSYPKIAEVVVRVVLSTGRVGVFTYVPDEHRLVLDGATFPQGAEKFTEQELEQLHDVARTQLDLGYRWSLFMPRVEKDDPEDDAAVEPESSEVS